MSTHLVKHQKITKRQIKEDSLVTLAFKATALWERHGSRILIVAGALALIGTVTFFLGQSRSKAEEKASGDLFRASLSVSQGDYVSATPMLQEIVDNQQGTRAARDAILYLGDSYAAQQKPGEAATWYRKYIEKVRGDRGMERTGYFALGTALENSREFIPSANAYAESAKRADSDNERGRSMLSEARCLVRGGQNVKAADLYRAIIALPGAEQQIGDAANARLGEIQAPASTP